MNPTEELYDSLQTAYNLFNERLFNNSLPPVMFTVQRKSGVMGFFAGDRWSDKEGRLVSELSINPSYIASSRLIEVMQTLVHEMVHCWQYFHGSPGRAFYHNKEWAMKMIEVGLMPSSTGEPGGKITGQFMGDYIIRGGKFLDVFNDLENNESIKLIWVDRRAIPRLYEPVIADPTNTDKPATENYITNKPDDFDVSETIDIEKPVNIDDIKTETLPLAKDLSLDSPLLAESLFLQEPIKRKTRFRYECEGCGAIIYGKKGLNVMCCDCNEKFIIE